MEKKELYIAWLKAKKVEEKAKKQRYEIEEEIEKNIPQIEGQSKTFSEDGFKIFIKKNESYNFLKTWEEIREDIPENLRPEKIKFDVDKLGLEYLKKHEPELYKNISDYIEYKIGKITIKIEKE